MRTVSFLIVRVHMFGELCMQLARHVSIVRSRCLLAHGFHRTQVVTKCFQKCFSLTTVLHNEVIKFDFCFHFFNYFCNYSHSDVCNQRPPPFTPHFIWWNRQKSPDIMLIFHFCYFCSPADILVDLAGQYCEFLTIKKFKIYTYFNNPLLFSVFFYFASRDQPFILWTIETSFQGKIDKLFPFMNVFYPNNHLVKFVA